MVEEVMPQWLLDVCAKVSKLGLYDGKSPNHVLINEYSAGQGIMPHTDGPLYYPTVAIISLSGGCLLDFFKPYREKGDEACGTDNCKDESEENPMTPSHPHQQPRGAIAADPDHSAESRRVGSVYLERRSLVVFRDMAYTDRLHGIREVSVDCIDSKVVNFKQCQLEVGTEVARGQTRVSMTIRVVPKTVKASKIFGRGR